jgi:hypothetical protein
MLTLFESHWTRSVVLSSGVALFAAGACAVGSSRSDGTGGGTGTAGGASRSIGSGGAVGSGSAISSTRGVVPSSAYATTPQGSGGSGYTTTLLVLDGGVTVTQIDDSSGSSGGGTETDSGVPSNLEPVTPPTCDPTACAANAVQCSCVAGPGGTYCAHPCPGNYCAAGLGTTPYCDCDYGGVVTCNP